MRGLNKVMIMGTLGRDPEMRYTSSGNPITSFTVVVPRTWRAADGERRTDQEWFNVVAWGDLAEICNSHLHKESPVYIEGRLQTRGWEDGTGTRHFRSEVVANEMIILDSRRKGRDGGNLSSHEDNDSAEIDAEDDAEVNERDAFDENNENNGIDGDSGNLKQRSVHNLSNSTDKTTEHLTKKDNYAF